MVPVVPARVRAPFRFERITVHHRRPGGPWQERDLLRSSDGTFAAELPASDVAEPGLEYYLTAVADGGAAHAAFAGPSWPHPVVVHGDEQERRALAELERRGGRSEVTTRAEYVDFDLGDRSGEVRDRYFRTEAEYRYALLGAVDELAIGAGVLRGTDEDTLTVGGVPVPPEPLRAYQYGYSELALRPGALVGLYGKLMLGVNHDDFGAGVESRLELGRQGGSRLELGAGAISALGSWGRLGLKWDTVPGTLMGAAVEVTTLPADEAAGVRLLYDLEVPVGRRVALAGRLGYQARGSELGGPSAGLGGTYRF